MPELTFVRIDAEISWSISRLKSAMQNPKHDSYFESPLNPKQIQMFKTGRLKTGEACRFGNLNFVF